MRSDKTTAVNIREVWLLCSIALLTITNMGTLDAIDLNVIGVTVMGYVGMLVGKRLANAKP